jgi:ELWxxDGT repeat protein
MPMDGVTPTPDAPVLASGSDSGIPGDNITNVTSSTIQGTGAEGAAFYIFVNDYLVRVVTVLDGVWSYTFDPLIDLAPFIDGPLFDGSYAVAIAVQQPGMLLSEFSDPLNLVIDTTAPTTQPTISLDPASDSGVTGDRITTDTTPGLRGQASAFAMVEITVDGTVVGSATASASGGWTYTPPDTLDLGSAMVTAREVDTAGNLGPASAGLALVIASPAPLAPGLAEASDGGAVGDNVTNDNTPTITGMAEAFADIRLLVGGRLLGTGTADADGNWSITPTQALADGRHDIRVQTVSGGVVSDVSDALTLFIDTEAPVTGRFLDVLVTADDGSGVREWFISSGSTFAPAVNIAPLGGSGIDDDVAPVVLGATNRVLFVGDDGTAGPELWVTNGTEAGTSTLTDLAPGAVIGNLTATTDGRAVFTTVDATDGTRLWVTDGSDFGTYALTGGGVFTVTPTRFVAANDGRVFFVAETQAYGRELWVTDGTAAGTAQVLDAAPGPANGQVGALAALMDDTLLFAVDDGTGSVTLLKTESGATTAITGWEAFGGALLSISAIVPLLGDQAIVIADVDGMGEEIFLVSGDSVVGGLDLTPGAAGSAIRDFTVLGLAVTMSGATVTLPDAFVFTFETAAEGRELGYIDFDGDTPIGGLLLDIAPGPDFANITGLTSIGDGRALFSAEDVAGNAELWITDGTSYGTYLLQEIRAGDQGSAPRDFTMVYPGTVLFTAIGDGGDREVWIYDGDRDGARQFDDLNTTGVSATPADPAEIVTLSDGRVVFNAGTEATGTELWISDGTKDGLYRLTDGLVGAGDGSPGNLVALPGDRVLFTLDDPATGRELWVTDGTEAGTAVLKDINPTGSADPLFLAPLDATAGLILFSADDGVAGRELWVTDGTAGGTVLLKDINPGAAGSDASDIVSLGVGKAIFAADDGAAGRELWITDGTADGTTLLKDLDGPGVSSSPRDITVLGNGTALFSTQFGRLWITDGTASGTVQLGDSYVSGASGAFTPVGGGRAIFLGLTPGEGAEPWITDGTEAGTTLLKDIRDGAGGSAAGDFTLLSDGKVLFRADDDIHGSELWITDLTSGDTRLLADIEPGIDSSAPARMVETVGGRVVFAATTVAYGRELWALDTVTGDTSLLLDIKGGAASSDPGTLTRMADGNVVFWADDGFRGRELWITDGTAAGTRLFSNTSADASSNPLNFTPVFVPGGMEAPELDETSDSGLFDNDRLTNDETLLVWGYGDAGATATVFVNDVAVGTTTAGPFGVWEMDLPTLAEGTHRVTFTLSDVAGNVSDFSPAIEITIDTTPPEATFTSLPVNSTAATLELGGEVPDGVVEVRLLLEGPDGGQNLAYAALHDEGGGVWSWSYSIVGAARGDWTITATAVDAAGNEDPTPEVQTITLLDSAPPVLAGLAATLDVSTPQIEAGPVLLDPDVTVTDPDGFFVSGSIVVSGQLAEDWISLADTSAIFVSGFDISFGGVAIGSFSGGTGGADFVIALTGTVDVAAVEAVVEAITFASDVDLGQARRTLTVTLDDGLGGTTSGDVVVNLAGRQVIGDDSAERLDGTGRSDRLGGRGGDDELFGKGGADSLNGGEGNDLLVGEDDNDTLNGGLGADTMEGGAGNDIFVVDHAADVVTELADGGIETVNASVNYVLGAEVERLVLTGIAIVGTGNALANTITGNASNNLLRGEDGNDTLSGGIGADTMEGGAGNDAFILDNADDRVTELAAGGIDLVYASVTHALGAEVERLVLTGAAAIDGTGNELANVITGNAANNLLRGEDGNDTLSGGVGADTMQGGAGNDAYFVDNAGDEVTEAAAGGVDLVYASVTYALGAEVERLVLTGAAAIDGTGNALANLLTGNAGNNLLRGEDGNDTLNGWLGVDTMEGGAGNDVYIVDSSDDVVTELAAGGIDVVNASASFTLGAEVERLVLTGTTAIDGTGNALANILTGNAGNNLLRGEDGNDTLNGWLGADTMGGGAGNDVYTVDNVDDVVTELAAGGLDAISASVTFTLGAEVERLVLTGAGNIDGTGNELANVITGNAGNNLLRGEDGNDTLNGWLGADTMEGGAGNDVYTVDNADDVVTEIAAGGLDIVNASASFTLGADVERLFLTGTADINGGGNGDANVITGNAGANRLQGGGGNDSLTGGLGADTLEGGAGLDRFIFATLDSSQAASPDIILDFVQGQDRVQVDAIDPSTAPGNQAFLWIGTAAFAGTGTAQARIWQDGTDTYAGFDDGSGGPAEMVIRFTGLLNLTALDFVL